VAARAFGIAGDADDVGLCLIFQHHAGLDETARPFAASITAS
jgi:hypothetical protein